MAASLWYLPYSVVVVGSFATPGATITFYTTGTTTKAPVYTTSALTVEHANPVIANGAGRFADIYLDDALTYRAVIKDATGTVLEDIDPYIPGVTSQTITTPSGASVPTRALLAAIATPAASQSAILTESGREGTFVFSTANLSTQVTADTRQGIYVAPSSDTTGASGAWVRQNGGYHKPEWFGALGNGTANDHAAFRGMSTLAAVIDYLHIELTPGAVYRIGKQNLNSTADGILFYEANENPIEAIGLSSLIIKGNGATLKFNDGLKYGGFNPADGTARTSTGNADNAHPGFLIFAKQTALVEIDGIIFDGNSASMVLGGDAPLAGYFECRHTAIKADSFSFCKLSNLESFNFLQDGVMVLHTASGLIDGDDKRPCLWENVHAHDIGRSNFSILGGNMVTLLNCSAVRSGGAPVSGGGTRGTAPQIALDIEAETINRNVLLDNCTLEQGANGLRCLSTVSGDNRDITFRDCKLVGKIWAQDTRILFENCRIYGLLERVYGNAAVDNDNTVFEKCLITDATDGDTPLQDNSGLLIGNASPTASGVKFHRCTFDMARLTANLADTRSRDSKLYARWNTAYKASGTNVIQLNVSGDHDGLDIIDSIAANFPASAYTATVTGTAKVRRSSITSASSYIKWIASGATGYVGNYDNAIGTGLGVRTNGNTSPLTLYPRADKRTQKWNAALTAGISVTPSTTGAGDGDEFLIVREAGATGAFNITVGSILTLSAEKQWGLIRYDSTAAAWKLVQYGTLP